MTAATSAPATASPRRPTIDRDTAKRLMATEYQRVIDRYPEGIEGKSFYQKNAPDLPGVRTAPIWAEGSSREIEYLLIDDERGLAALANLAAVPLHVWSSRVPGLDRPDWSILDLDPKGAPFAWVVHRPCGS